MLSILFSLEAICMMLVECYKAGSRFETGGIMTGPKAHDLVITDVLPSTSYAERGSATYFQSKKDVQILNDSLRKYQSKGYDFKGYFHKHPSGLKSLSKGDIKTCFEILTSPNYKINNLLIMSIITETSTLSFPVFTYFVSLGDNNVVIVREASVKVLPNSCIQECVECFEPLKKGVSHESPYLRQDNERVRDERKGHTLRYSGKHCDDNQRSRKEKRIGKARAVSLKQKGSTQVLTK